MRVLLRNIFVFTVFLLQSLVVIAKEDCSLKGIALDDDAHVSERLFYTGTCHYRNKDYSLSATAWRELAQLKNVPPEYEGYQIDVLNNLGYLLFFGYGLEKNQREAMNYWRQAISLGHTESEYHLCHAYADNEESTYDVFKAKKHCAKALLIYQGMEDPDQEILNQLEAYNSQVNG